MEEEHRNQTTILGENINQNSDENTNQDNIADKAAEKDYLAELIGEGKKFSTIEDAAKALAKKAAHADSFIETLKNEKRALEAELTGAKKVEDILDALNINNKSEEKEDSFETNKFSEDNLRKEVQRLLNEEKEVEKKKVELDKIKTNQTKSWELLSSEFNGIDNAKEIVKTYIGNDTTKANIINQLGSFKPEELVLFLKAYKNNVPSGSTIGSETKLNISEFEMDSKNKGITWEQAKEIRKKNPKLYRSHKFQKLLHSANFKL